MLFKKKDKTPKSKSEILFEFSQNKYKAIPGNRLASVLYMKLTPDSKLIKLIDEQFDSVRL